MTDFMIPLVSAVALIMLAVILYRKVTFRHRCPVCGNRHTDRVARPRWLKALFPSAPIRAYRCLDCYQKYIQIDLSSTRTPHHTV